MGKVDDLRRMREAQYDERMDPTRVSVRSIEAPRGRLISAADLDREDERGKQRPQVSVPKGMTKGQARKILRAAAGRLDGGLDCDTLLEIVQRQQP